jgi:hypothetical protein
MITKAQADKASQKAIADTRKGIAKLEAKRSKHRGRELADINDQIAQYERTIRVHEQAMRSDG